MKKFYLAVCLSAVFLTACTQDLDSINSRLDDDAKSLTDIQERLTEAEGKLGLINSDLHALTTLRGGIVVNKVEGSGSQGWKLTLSNGIVLTVPGTPDSFGNAPVVSVDAEGYWMVDYGGGAVYVLDIDGNKVSSIGHGESGKPGVDGLSPILGLDKDGFWTVSFDNGSTWQHVLNDSGNKVMAVITSGDSLFEGISAGGNTVIVTLKTGESFTVPLVPDFLCAIEGAGEHQIVPKGGTRTFNVQMKGVLSAVVTCPNGWTASLEDNVLTVGAPATKAYFSSENCVAIFAVNAAGYSTISKMTVEAGILITDSIISEIKAYPAVDTTVNIENEFAGKFLSEVTYTDADWTQSSIMDYATGHQFITWTQPIGMMINWTPGTDNQILVLVDDEGNLTTTELGIGAGAYKLWNLVPGVTYRYGVVNSGSESQTLVTKGAFAASGQLRMIRVPGVYNVRDLGGWAGHGGKHIAYGLIYRGGRLDQWTDGVRISVISKADISIFKSLGITCDIDLRGSGETGGTTESPLSVDYYRFSVNPYYEGLSKKSSQELYVKAIREIFSRVRQGKPVYFHCAAGADRTGTLAMLLEGLLGVSESDIAKDYELTSFYTERRRNNDGEYSPVSGVQFLKALGGNDINVGIYNYCVNTLGLTAVEIEEFRSIMLK